MLNIKEKIAYSTFPLFVWQLKENVNKGGGHNNDNDFRNVHFRRLLIGYMIGNHVICRFYHCCSLNLLQQMTNLNTTTLLSY